MVRSGNSLIWIVATLVLICESGTALKCYQCIDLYDQTFDTDAACRSSVESLAALECERPNRTDPEYTPACTKAVGNVIFETDSSAGASTEAEDIVRTCGWFPPDMNWDQCFSAPSEDQPLEVVSLVESALIEVFDISTVCLCTEDRCNGVEGLEPSFGPMLFALVHASALVVLTTP